MNITHNNERDLFHKDRFFPILVPSLKAGGLVNQNQGNNSYGEDIYFILAINLKLSEFVSKLVSIISLAFNLINKIC